MFLIPPESGLPWFKDLEKQAEQGIKIRKEKGTD